jgi:hypothetical protein
MAYLDPFTYKETVSRSSLYLSSNKTFYPYVIVIGLTTSPVTSGCPRVGSTKSDQLASIPADGYVLVQ